MPESRADHLVWCKERAHAYIERGELAQALASMMSDLKKHSDFVKSTDSAFYQLGMFEVMNNNVQGMTRFIDGFN